MGMGLSEGLAMGTKAGLHGSDIMDVITEGAIASPMYGLKGPKMLAGDYAPNFPLKHQQKDVRLAIALGEQVGQAMPVAVAANETFKRAKCDKSEEDFCAVFEAVKK